MGGKTESFKVGGETAGGKVCGCDPRESLNTAQFLLLGVSGRSSFLLFLPLCICLEVSLAVHMVLSSVPQYSSATPSFGFLRSVSSSLCRFLSCISGFSLSFSSPAQQRVSWSVCMYCLFEQLWIILHISLELQAQFKHVM